MGSDVFFTNLCRTMKHDNCRANYTVSHHCYRGFNFEEYKRFTVSAETKDKNQIQPTILHMLSKVTTQAVHVTYRCGVQSQNSYLTSSG